MADLHHHHDTAVVADREGPATALIVTLVLAFAAIMLWLFLGTNVFVNHGTSNNNPGVTKIVNQPQGGDGGTSTTTNTGTTGTDGSGTGTTTTP